MDLAHDWMAYTVMSYRSYRGADVDLGFTNGDWGFAQTYMMEDIAALQFLYGANYNYRSGDTTYTWSPATGEEFVNGGGQGAPGGDTIFMTVWDGGGTDTYDFSNYSAGATIDLRPGTFTSLHQQLPDLGGGGAPGNVATALLYQGDARSLIENAIGTSGDDQIAGNDAANFLDGRDGDNEIYGYGGKDTLIGGNDSDVLHGGDDSDSLSGGGGDDSLEGDAGSDRLDGGNGSDRLFGGNGNDTLIGGDGDDWLNAGPGTNTLDGGTGNDRLEGDNQADNLVGGEGNDTLYGFDGDDTMTGGAGDDTYYVEDAGDAVIEAEAEGFDKIWSTASIAVPANVEQVFLSDIKYGVFLTGLPINATGNAQDNLIVGNFQSNEIDGGLGADTLSGAGGDDKLDGGGGADTLVGGWGNDTFIVDTFQDVVTENVGEGTDTVRSSVNHTLEANVETLVLSGTARVDGTGNSLANTLTGNTAANTLDGGAGNDTLAGGSGNDVLIGGVGDDVLGGGLGTDTASYAGLGGGVTVSLAVAGAQDTGAGGSDTLGSIERLVGTRYADSLTGNAGANTLDGGGGADTLAGGAGNDTYWADIAADVVVEQAGEGADTVHAARNYTLADNVERLILEGTANTAGTGNAAANGLTGNAGDNVLDGRGGADNMAGGLGNDTYRVDNAGDLVVERSGAGSDTVLSSVGLTLGDYIENLTLTGSAAVDGDGNRLANTLTGNNAANTLAGFNGNDTLTGGAGNDTLGGGTGADSLDGGSWNDVLVGSLGADFLTGGTGADTFVFAATSDSSNVYRDTIEDFTHSQHDLIDLSAIDAIAGGADDGFTLTDAFHHTAGELVIRTIADGHYRVLGDTDGDGHTDLGIDVFSATALGGADFVL
jgi:Ca2+-binding RTX toxin-like protein